MIVLNNVYSVTDTVGPLSFKSSSTGDFISCCNFILVVIMQSTTPSLGADLRIIFYIPAWPEASHFCHAMPCSTKLESVLMSYLSKKKSDQLKSRYR